MNKYSRNRPHLMRSLRKSQVKSKSNKTEFKQYLNTIFTQFGLVIALAFAILGGGFLFKVRFYLIYKRLASWQSLVLTNRSFWIRFQRISKYQKSWKIIFLSYLSFFRIYLDYTGRLPRISKKHFKSKKILGL